MGSYSQSMFVDLRRDLCVSRTVKLLKQISPVVRLFAERWVHKHTWLSIPLNSDYGPLSFLWDLFTTSPDIVLTGCREVKPSPSLKALIAHNHLPSPAPAVVVTFGLTNLESPLFFFISCTHSLLSLSKLAEGCHRSSWGFDTHRFTSCSTCFIRRLEEDGWLIRLI